MSFNLFWGGAPPPMHADNDRPQNEEIADNESTIELQQDDYDDSEPDYYNPQTGEKSRLVPGAAKTPKPRRVPGGIAAIAKPIVADYDSDDARIIDLKQQNYADEYVANKLKEEGRIRYVAKTVGSRWLRLRKVLESKDDERLDDEMSDWHIGEDEMVAKIKDDVDKKFAIQFQRLEEKKWKEVSIYLADKMGKKKYTARACEERFEQVKAGTALLPIELDEDQAGRREMREKRIAQAKATRTAKEQAVKDAEQAKKDKLEARKQARTEAAERKRQLVAQRTAEKEERERIKVEREENRLQAKQDREYRLALLRSEREWELARWRHEKLLYKQYTKQSMGGKSGGSGGRRKTKDGYDTASEEELSDRFESGEEDFFSDSDSLAYDESDEGRRDSMVDVKKTPARRANPARKAKSSSAKKGKGKGKAINYSDEAAFDMPDEIEQPMNKATVTEESLQNPRSIMTMEELELLISQRELERIQPGETQPEVVARLMYADTKLNKAELDNLLRCNSEKVSGTKAARMARLQQAEASKSEMGMHGLTSGDLDFMRDYEPYQGEFAYLLQETEDAMDLS